ncbi:MAG TPA: hypothetical protein VLK29_11550 [Luteimonas sp.]|nr:hypothetical protein [Luteimonas sp.]
MNRATHEHDVDARARALHGRAVHQVPVRTLRALRARRNAMAPAAWSPSRLAWPMAGAFAALAAVAVVLLQAGGSVPAPAGVAHRVAMVAAPVPDGDADGDAYAALDEDPDLYLWLASQDAQPLAME